jgi:hypothetical protein
VQVLAEQLQMAIDSALADVADSAHELASSDTRKQSAQRVPTIR